MTRTCIATLLIGLTASALGGCVRRTITVQTEPPGALVWLNDEEAGRTPLSVDFTWYGDYDVLVRMEGYETLRTHRRLDPPWYQLPPFDFVAEALVPVRYHDRRLMEFTLEPKQYPTDEELLEQAVSFRERATGMQE